MFIFSGFGRADFSLTFFQVAGKAWFYAGLPALLQRLQAVKPEKLEDAKAPPDRKIPSGGAHLLCIFYRLPCCSRYWPGVIPQYFLKLRMSTAPPE